jgi:hypothetical protein
MFAELERQLLIVPWTLFTGALTIADTPGIIAQAVVPWNSILVGFQASYQIETAGTTPECTFEFRRSTTVLSSCLVTTVATMTRNTGLNVRLNAGETININGTPFNTDNSFAGVCVVAEIQIVLNS